MNIEISKEWTSLSKYTNNDGRRCSGYESYNASGRGKLVATIVGDATVEHSGSIDFIRLGGETWAIRDVLAMAQRGERGLEVLCNA